MMISAVDAELQSEENRLSTSCITNEPLIFTPTDAAHISKSVGALPEEDVAENGWSQRRSSRLPLMHPRWYATNNNSADNLSGASINSGTSQHEALTKAISRNDIPGISITFNRHKYYSRLVHPTDDRMRIPDHVLPSSMFYVIPTKSTEQQSSLVTIFAIWNTMMGTSLLSMSWGLVQAGMMLGIILIILMGLLTLYTAYRVLQSKDFLDYEAFEFCDVCKHYFGRFGEWIAIIFSLVTFLGGMMVYWVLMSNFLYVIGIFVHEKTTNHNFTNNASHPEVLCPTGYPIPHPPNASDVSLYQLEDTYNLTMTDPIQSFSPFWTSDRTVPLYLAAIVLPLLNFKSPTFFTKFNCLGTLSVIFILVFVITKAVNWGWNFEFIISFDPQSYQLPNFRSTFPALTGMLSLAYFLHSAVITILKNNRHPENNVRDLSVGYLLVALTYLTVAVVFYGSFPLPKACIAANLLENLSSLDTFATIARFFLLFQMLSVYPLLAYMCRVIALYAIFKKAWPGLFHVLVVNVIIVSVCILVAVFYPHIGDVIRYSGSLCGLVYVFCLPCVVYLQAMRSFNKLTPFSIIAHSLIIIIGVANFVSQFFIRPSI